MKYIMLIQQINSNPDQPELLYMNSIGEIFDEVKEYLLDEDEDEHLLSISNEQASERMSEKDIRFFIYKNGESYPFSSLDEETDFHEWLEEMTNINEGPFKNEGVMKFEQFNEGKKDKFPNVKKVEIDGFIVYIGRDALSNDHLTFNMAQPEDIWMHAKGVPGSHVIIRIRENLPTKETLKKVAELVAKNSKSKSEKTTVVYCQRRFVKKEKGMNPGQVKVDYVNAEEITI